MHDQLQEARELVLAAGNELVREGLIARTWGNISARISDTQFVITPTGRAYHTLKAEDIVVVNVKDLSWEGDIRPSSERGVHSMIYQERPEVNFVIHTHQAYASALSVSGDDIPAQEVIPCSRYGRNASPEIQANMRRAVHDHPAQTAFLMQHHGAVGFGGSREQAFESCYQLEQRSRDWYRRICGSDVPELRFGYTAPKPEGDFSGDIDLSDRPFVRDGRIAMLSRAPYTKILAAEGRELPAYIEDFAQIAGVSVTCVASLEDEAAIEKALSACDAVLVKDQGALCTGVSREDVEAQCMIFEKNCLAALLAEKTGAAPVEPADALWDRDGSLESYSKLIATNL